MRGIPENQIIWEPYGILDRIKALETKAAGGTIHPSQIVQVAAESGRRGATKIIAASNSYDKSRADYVCDGAADDVEINQAVWDIRSVGGTILLLEGQYNIDDTIQLYSYIDIYGQGPGTVIKASDDFPAYNYMINCGNYNTIKDISIIGHGLHTVHGVDGPYALIRIYSGYTDIFANEPFAVYQCRLWAYNTILRYLSGIAANNYLHDGGLGTDSINGILGIGQESLSIGNYIIDLGGNAIDTANAMDNYIANCNYGISLASGSEEQYIAEGNIIINPYIGIYIHGYARANITGNTIINAQHEGIYVDQTAAYISITGNRITGSSQAANNTYAQIFSNGDYGLIANNYIYELSGMTPKAKYPIWLGSSSSKNSCSNNFSFNGGQTNSLKNDGTSNSTAAGNVFLS